MNSVCHIPDTFLEVCIALTSGIAGLFIPLFFSVVIRLDEHNYLVLKIGKKDNKLT